MTDTRRIRTFYLQKFHEGDSSNAVTDDALSRISSARNTASKSANTFLLFSVSVAALYLLKLENLANEVKLGEYKLATLPFGQFVFCAVALFLSTVSQIRIADSRTYDRLLMAACEKKFGNGAAIGHHFHPNEFAWGEPLSAMIHSVQLGPVSRWLRNFVMLFIGILLLTAVLSPAFCAADFLWNERWKATAEFNSLQKWSIVVLTVGNILTFILTLIARFIDRD